ncbi:hypothetical protein PoB_007037000 [Plakobranchus ocellatus]|uniref:Uncharacterized protein n=1 Tax=Plakobranchus ocellatus TaxID=259542 RepID=A0AAV4DIP5_9GAST|nr:hypothetical protein PoB_007037000 [Plakobranchus ocellatus]
MVRVASRTALPVITYSAAVEDWKREARWSLPVDHRPIQRHVGAKKTARRGNKTASFDKIMGIAFRKFHDLEAGTRACLHSWVSQGTKCLLLFVTSEKGMDDLAASRSFDPSCSTLTSESSKDNLNRVVKRFQSALKKN